LKGRPHSDRIYSRDPLSMRRLGVCAASMVNGPFDLDPGLIVAKVNSMGWGLP
jgi:hypothetical protein